MMKYKITPLPTSHAKGLLDKGNGSIWASWTSVSILVKTSDCLEHATKWSTFGSEREAASTMLGSTSPLRIHGSSCMAYSSQTLRLPRLLPCRRPNQTSTFFARFAYPEAFVLSCYLEVVRTKRRYHIAGWHCTHAHVLLIDRAFSLCF